MAALFFLPSRSQMFSLILSQMFYSLADYADFADLLDLCGLFLAVFLFAR